MAVLSPKKPLHLILVEDHEMVREGIARTLDKEPDLKVVGQCASSAEALRLLQGPVDMVLLDVDLGEERALAFVDAARKQNFEGRILVVTAGISGPRPCVCCKPESAASSISAIPAKHCAKPSAKWRPVRLIWKKNIFHPWFARSTVHGPR